MIHCWEKGPDTKDGMGTTCMLEDEHKGKHKFVRDDEVMEEFS